MRGLYAIAFVLMMVSGVPGDSSPSQAPPERIEVEGIENLYRLSPRLYSGGEPLGAEGFRALEALGVRTIVTVDGAAPDLETARRHGLRYVHLPIGYDGIPQQRAVELVRALQTLPGPVFVHCHHGKHRGPAAAALGAMAVEGWTREQAKGWLETAGTSPDYAGLYAGVANFTPPSAEELAQVPDRLPERAEVSAMVESMVRIDALWENLKAIADAGFRPPPDHPDLDPAHEALMLAEHYRELRRLDDARRMGEDFLERLDASERRATDLRDTLIALPTAPDDRRLNTTRAALEASGNDCKHCHVRHRDATAR